MQIILRFSKYTWIDFQVVIYHKRPATQSGRWVGLRASNFGVTWGGQLGGWWPKFSYIPDTGVLPRM